jgi:rubrerythrin
MKTLLMEITKDINIHARWLNSLSYLEYRGFRKIARSQKTEDIDEDLLTHAMEEVRHALFFKKLSIKIGGSKFSSYEKETLFNESAIKTYFYDLDWGIADLCAQYGVQDKKSLYHIVTWLIEERAMQVYQKYEEALNIRSLDISLRPIIADEARHLDGVRNLAPSIFLNDKIKIENLVHFEEGCFKKLWYEFYLHLEMDISIENLK